MPSDGQPNYAQFSIKTFLGDDLEQAFAKKKVTADDDAKA